MRTRLTTYKGKMEPVLLSQNILPLINTHLRALNQVALRSVGRTQRAALTPVLQQILLQRQKYRPSVIHALVLASRGDQVFFMRSRQHKHPMAYSAGRSWPPVPGMVRLHREGVKGEPYVDVDIQRAADLVMTSPEWPSLTHIKIYKYNNDRQQVVFRSYINLESNFSPMQRL